MTGGISIDDDDIVCPHLHLTLEQNEEFEGTASYKDGMRPYKCDNKDCKRILWARPMEIIVRRSQ